ncbi:MAG TPA: HD domain-containing protein, partial [Archangium sp.]
MRIRDPIHGSITVSDEETRVIDSRTFQRLRHVRQLGFGDLAFPGATHTRHAHSLGAMHVASRLFDAITSRSDLPQSTRERFRAAVRLAVLCHDIGHMPLSHASESIAPKRGLLKLPSWMKGEPDEQASHEDFTAKLLLDSELTRIIETTYAAQGITPQLVASLVTGELPPGVAGFTEGGIDWTP